jgi:hypothetical protein
MKCLTGFGFQDVLLLIGLKGLTGELMIESGNSIGSMFFQRGKILQAFSPYSRAIGDILVDNGIITEVELLQMLHEQKQTGLLPIGSMFIKTGKVGFDTIELMVHDQVRHAVKDFVSWQKLNVSFVEREVMAVDSIHLPVYEFIAPETLNAVRAFGIAEAQSNSDNTSAPAVSPLG